MSRVHGRDVFFGHFLQVVHLREDVSHVGVELAEKVVALMEESELCTHVGEEL